MEATRERKPELVIVDQLTDKQDRKVLVGYRGDDVRIAITSNRLTCVVDLDGEQRDRFMRAFAAAEQEIEHDDAELEHRRERAAESGTNKVEQAARDLIGIPDGL
jgi:hypothetical protein